MPSNKVSTKKSSQSVFTRAVKNIKKRHNFIQLDDSKKDIQPKVKKAVPIQNEDESRGVVYLGHIPPGFYENEMRKYFNQFGHVTRIKVARSKKTGQSKGYAFIEFRYAEVAKVVAETMNNYLMCSRLLKAAFVDKKYSNNFWKPVTPDNCPKAINRRRDIMIKNSLISPVKELEFVKNKKKKLGNLLEKLKSKGIAYDFQPTDDVSSEIQISSTEEKFSQDLEQTPDSMHLPVFEVDESDIEIDFKTPPNVIKKVLKRKNTPVESATPKTKKSKESHSSKKRSDTNIKTFQLTNKKSSLPVAKSKSRIPTLKTGIGNGKFKSKSKIPCMKPSKKKA